MVAAIAVAVIGPTPGMVARRWLVSFARCHSRMRFSNAAISASSAVSCVPSADKAALAEFGNSVSSRQVAASAYRTPTRPRAETIPYSSRWPREPR